MQEAVRDMWAGASRMTMARDSTKKQVSPPKMNPGLRKTGHFVAPGGGEKAASRGSKGTEARTCMDS